MINSLLCWFFSLLILQTRSRLCSVSDHYSRVLIKLIGWILKLCRMASLARCALCSYSSAMFKKKMHCVDCWNLLNTGVFFPKTQSYKFDCGPHSFYTVWLCAEWRLFFLHRQIVFSFYFNFFVFVLCTSANWKDQMLFDRRSAYRLNDNYFVHVHQYLCETIRRPFKLSSTCIHFPWLLSCCCQTYLFHIPFCPCLLWKGVFRTKQHQKEVKDQRLWYSI